MAVTKLANLVKPDVMAGLVQKKLVNNLVFQAVADIDTTLVGQPGNRILFPSFNYIQAADVVGEGSTISVATLTASTVSATIQKWAKGVSITDEAALSGYGDPIGQAAEQIGLSLRDAIDNACLTTLAAISSAMTQAKAGSSVAPSDINLALEKFGEDVDGTKVVFVEPALYTELRTASKWLPASEIAADRVVKGAVGEAYGCQVVVSNRLKSSHAAYIVKPGALRIIMKKDIEIEADRDILKKLTVITGAVHGVTYLYDASKAIKIV